MQGSLGQEWCSISKKRSHNIKADQVYFYSRKIKGKTGSSTKIVIYIGREITSLLDWKLNDSVEVFFNNFNQNLLKISKSDVPHSFKLSNNLAEKVLRIQFYKPDQLKINESKTVSVEFDLTTDKALLIDLSKIRNDE